MGESMDEKYIVLDIETTGLNPWYGDKVTCICAKDSEGKKHNSITTTEYGSERDSIRSFTKWIRGHDTWEHYILITKNGKLFDVPFILTREELLERDAQRIIFRLKHIDLHEVTKKPVSLSEMATLLGCQQKTGDGKNAIQLWKDGKYQELQDYCMNDVEVTEQVYIKLKELKVVK